MLLPLTVQCSLLSQHSAPSSHSTVLLPLQVVFLFAQESDSLLVRLRLRCEEAGFSCSSVATADATLETMDVDHLVVVVDVRWQESVDNDGVMK